MGNNKSVDLYRAVSQSSQTISMPSSHSLDILPTQRKFESNELSSLLEVARDKYPNCKILLQTQILGRQRQRVIIFQEGNLAFCGDRTPHLDDFVDLLRQKINPDWITRILESSKTNLNQEMTVRQFCERLLQMRVIQKNDLFKTLLSTFLLSCEPFWSASGMMTVNPLPNQNTYAPVDWLIFKAAIEKRHLIWQKFTALPQGINSIPIITESGFKALQSSQDNPSQGEDKLIQFIEQSINGRNDIADLAKKQTVDPLSMAKRLVQGIEKGWLSLGEGSESPTKTRGKILVVDDNPTTRKLLVTILQEFFETHATPASLGTASLIPNKKIDLVIVAQSVPKETSLQLCKVIRQNPTYQHMPFLIISSNENFFERAKAKMVGVTEFLTQPLDRTKILYALDYHLSKS